MNFHVVKCTYLFASAANHKSHFNACCIFPHNLEQRFEVVSIITTCSIKALKYSDAVSKDMNIHLEEIMNNFLTLLFENRYKKSRDSLP